MNFDFYKIFTGKNDLILISLLKEESFPLEYLPRISRRLCLRREGIGGNGVLFLSKGTETPLKLRYFRPDGEESILFNDALLCLSRYVFDSGMTGNKKLTVETLTGTVNVDLLDSQNFRLNLGTPRALDQTPLIPNPDGDFFNIVRLNRQNLSLIPLFLQKRLRLLLFLVRNRGRFSWTEASTGESTEL